VTKRSHVKQANNAARRTDLAMADLPDRLTTPRHIELRGRNRSAVGRRIGLLVLGAILILGLANVFGQKPATHTYRSAAADLELQAPARVRSGLLYQARFTIRAHRKLDHVVLQLAPGWAESQTINTIEPSPIAETSRNGSLVLTLGPVPAGQHFTLWMQLQVNPTNVGRRSADVALYDGNTRLVAADRTLTVFP
jgi:hypothetical protein